MSGPVVPPCPGIGLPVEFVSFLSLAVEPVASKGMCSQVWVGVGIRGLKVDVEPLSTSFLSSP